MVSQHNPVGAPQSEVAHGTKTSTLALVGFLLSVLPIALVNIAGIVLGAIAWSQIKAKPNELKGKGFAMAAIILGSAWTFITVIALLAAIAIPAFLTYKNRAIQSSVKLSLTHAYQSQEMHRMQNAEYAVSFEQLGWKPHARNYTYYLGSSRLAPEHGEPAALERQTPLATAAAFRVYAVANLDGDKTLDVWSIDDGEQLVNISDDTND